MGWNVLYLRKTNQKKREGLCLLICLNMSGISLKGHRIMSFQTLLGTSGERRHFNVKDFCAVAVFIICIYYFSSVKILLFKKKLV